MVASLVSAIHLLSLGVGLGAIFIRFRALRGVARGDDALNTALAGDALWLLALAAWFFTGWMRLVLALDKSVDFYTTNGFFMVKMTLFLVVLLLEVGPLVASIRWRFARRRGREISTGGAKMVAAISAAQIVLVLLLPFAAAFMARGVWLLE